MMDNRRVVKNTEGGQARKRGDPETRGRCTNTRGEGRGRSSSCVVLRSKRKCVHKDNHATSPRT